MVYPVPFLEGGGVKLGGPKLAQARKMASEAIGAAADNHAPNVLPVVRARRRCGRSRTRLMPGWRRQGAGAGTR